MDILFFNLGLFLSHRLEDTAKYMKHYLFIFLLLFITGELAAQLDLDKDYSYDHLEELLVKAREENNHHMLADVYYKLGLFEKEKLNNDKLAYENFSRSRDYYKIINNQDQLFMVERLIIGKSMETGLYSEAISSLSKILDKYENKNETEKTILLYMDLSKAYKGKGDIERELEYQNLALSQNKQLGNEELEMEIFLNRIDSYRDINELDSAMLFSKIVLKNALESEHNEYACKALSKQGRIFQIQKNYKAALASFKQAQVPCGNRPYSADRLNMYEGLSSSYEKLGDFGQAYEYVKKYSALNDSILNQERSTSLSNLSYKFGVQEKNKELKLLELENNYALERNSQQRRALWVLGLGLAALTVLLYYTIRVYKQRIEANRLITIQKEEINNQQISKLEDDIKINSMKSMLEGQEIERERIAKDLHDSLGGVLSTIKLQFDSVQNKVKGVGDIREYKKAHTLIDAAVDEVRSISQNLQPSSLENLGLIAAIKDLINRFDGPKYPDIDFQFYSFPEGLNKMTSLYIYRMVQELLHNSIKHAQASEIMIQLIKDEDELVIHFEDDGIGFDPENTRKGGMGMDNLKGRASYLKGSITIDSKIGEGSSFLIHIPYSYAG